MVSGSWRCYFEKRIRHSSKRSWPIYHVVNCNSDRSLHYSMHSVLSVSRENKFTNPSLTDHISLQVSKYLGHSCSAFDLLNNSCHQKLSLYIIRLGITLWKHVFVLTLFSYFFKIILMRIKNRIKIKLFKYSLLLKKVSYQKYS